MKRRLRLPPRKRNLKKRLVSLNRKKHV